MAALQASEQVDLQEFSLFKKFPIEIRRMILAFALPLLHMPQFIQLSLSDPFQTFSRDDFLKNPVSPWKHMFFSSRQPVPLLLHTCSESRQAAKAFYTQSWETKADGWGYTPMIETYPEPTSCGISEEFDKVAKQMYWKPETDVVLFQHDDEPYRCWKSSICNAKNPCYAFWFDKRIRFAAMPRDVFQQGVPDGGNLHIPDLEVLFVLVEGPNMNEVLPSIGRTERVIRSEFNHRKDARDQVWSSPEVTGKIFQYGDRKDHLGRIVVKSVTSLHEIEQIVAGWPPRPAVV